MSKKKPKARSPGKLETAIQQSLSKVSVKKLVAMNIPYLIAFYVVEKCAWLYRHCIGGTVVQKLGVMLMNLPVAFRSWIPSFHIRDLLAGIIGALLLRCVVYMKGKNAKKFRQGEEYGSARWGNEKDIEPFIDPVFENNIILTQTERLTMNSRPKLPKYARNKNVIVIGGSGSGKTRFYVKPNLMQMPDNVSYVVTDPKGTIIVECGTMLVRHGYRIKVLNTINFKKSMHYNPFHYIRSEKDILKLVNTIIANTKGEGEKAAEDFWIKAERLLYTALIRSNGNRMLTVALQKMEQYSSEYETENGEDKEAIIRFIEYVSGKTKRMYTRISYNISDSSLFHLQMLLDEQLLDKKLAVKSRQNDMIMMQAEADQLDSYLSVDIDEKAIAKIYKKIKQLEQELIEIDVQITRKSDERRTANGELMFATSEFSKRVESYLKKVELNDDSDRIIKYSHMANTILEEYKVRLQKNKIEIVAETMTSCYKRLANKKNLIEKIEMDPVTLDLKYFDSDGKEVNKSSLSAGEKQLMVISLLWALALCSKKKLPVIIDTPLSRLDSAHRVSLIQTYFPQASEQTIILSTDSEIDKNYYEIMKDNIGDEFTLIYDDETKSTTIKKGYFLGVEK